MSKEPTYKALESMENADGKSFFCHLADNILSDVEQIKSYETSQQVTTAIPSFNQAIPMYLLDQSETNRIEAISHFVSDTSIFYVTLKQVVYSSTAVPSLLENFYDVAEVLEQFEKVDKQPFMYIETARTLKLTNGYLPYRLDIFARNNCMDDILPLYLTIPNQSLLGLLGWQTFTKVVSLTTKAYRLVFEGMREKLLPRLEAQATTAPSDILRDDLKEEEVIEGLKAIRRKVTKWRIACWFTVHKVFTEGGFYKGKGNITYQKFIAWVEKHFDWPWKSKQFDTTVDSQLKTYTTSQWDEMLDMAQDVMDMYCNLQKEIWHKFTELDEHLHRKFRAQFLRPLPQ